MPHFYFDLVMEDDFKDQGGMILEDCDCAFDKADQLASQLSIVRPELRRRGCVVRVSDGDGKEVYRTPIDAIPFSSDAKGGTLDYKVICSPLNRGGNEHETEDNRSQGASVSPPMFGELLHPGYDASLATDRATTVPSPYDTTESAMLS
jgi:hypothetical protein